MKFFPTDRNSIALLFVLLTTLGFFVAGLFDILDYIIIKFLLCSCFMGLLVIALYFASKNKKNRLEDFTQDDSH